MRKSFSGTIALPKRRPKLVAFDCPALRDIRHRAAEVGLSLRELDRRAGTGRYVQRSTRRVWLRSIVRAAALLHGEVIIRSIELQPRVPNIPRPFVSERIGPPLRGMNDREDVDVR